MTDKISKLLISGKPVMFQEELAMLIGVVDAIVLQKVHYWLCIQEEAGKHFIGGRFWNFNSMPGWQEELPFFSESTLERSFKRLRDKGIVLVDNYNQLGMDKTLWYSIDYEALSKLIGSSCQNDEMDSVKLTISSK